MNSFSNNLQNWNFLLKTGFFLLLVLENSTLKNISNLYCKQIGLNCKILNAEPFNACLKMVGHTLKILHHLLQDFKVCLTILGHFVLKG